MDENFLLSEDILEHIEIQILFLNIWRIPNKLQYMCSPEQYHLTIQMNVVNYIFQNK